MSLLLYNSAVPSGTAAFRGTGGLQSSIYKSIPPNLTRTSLVATATANPLAIIVNAYNGYIYYVASGVVSVITTSGSAVTTVTPSSGYNIQAFGGGLAVNPDTGIVYFQYLNGTQWGFGAIAPGTYSVTYNSTTSFPGPSRGMHYLNGFIYSGYNQTISQINVSTWAVSTYNTYSGSVGCQGITASGNDLYIMLSPNGAVYKNTSTTPLISTQDYWGLASDGYYLYMGGAGTQGVYRTVIGTWPGQTQIITSGTYNPPGLIISMFYYKGVVYIAGFVNSAIIALTT